MDYYWRPKGLTGNYETLPYAWHSYGLTTSYNTYSAAEGVSDTLGRSWWYSPTWNQDGQLENFRNGTDETINYTYETNSKRIASISGKRGDSAFHKQDFSFDKIGNLTGRTITKINGQNWQTIGTDVQEYGYDALNRLNQRKNGTNWDTIANYDAKGNITSKEGVSGSFIYAGTTTRPHAVTEANGWTIGYDANGNMATRSKAGETWTFNWTSFNQPSSISATVNGVLNQSTFVYDASLQGVVHSKMVNGVTESRTHYILGGIEQEQKPVVGQQGAWEVTKTTIYVFGPGGIVGMLVHDASDHKRFFFHYDHIGSLATVTQETGFHQSQVLNHYTYDAWGRRTKWTATWTADTSVNLTERGFTYHEMMDHLGLVNMNGRLYDPLLGRFLSADPTLQFPGNFQNYNRYSYVHNNPLSHTDPSGFSIGSFFKKFWRPILAIVLSIVTAGAAAALLLGLQGGIMAGITGLVTGSLASAAGVASISLTTSMMIGAVGGFFGGLVMGGLKGALFGALTGAITGAIGSKFGSVSSAAKDIPKEMARAMAHGVTGGVMAEVQGGKFSAGFLSSACSSVGDSYTGNWGYANVAKCAVIGVTASELGGGKFENGAVTGAFTYLFNDALSSGQKPRLLIEAERKAFLASLKG
ncbi:MAG: RHS repeat-associated core domain-containing protein [Verrucomicrobiota bacterium]|nr:RHS repeat-associated core domain-containing protein [Verrucomicrobiota bacterium]